MKINQYLIIAFHLIFGSIFIIYILYIRIFFKRLPKDLYFMIEDHFRYSIAFFSCLSILICAFILIKNILTVYEISLNSSSIITKGIHKITVFINTSLYHVYQVFMEYFILDSYTKIASISKKFYNIFSFYGEYTFLFMQYFIRLFIVCCFLFDVFVFFQLFYFYKSLILLSISLLIELFFFILRDFAQNLDDVNSMLIVKDSGLDKKTQLPITSYSFRPEYENRNLDLDYYIGQYILCSKITGYLEFFDKYALFFGPRINIFIYLLYFIGWSSVIFINLPSIISLFL